MRLTFKQRLTKASAAVFLLSLWVSTAYAEVPTFRNGDVVMRDGAAFTRVDMRSGNRAQSDAVALARMYAARNYLRFELKSVAWETPFSDWEKNALLGLYTAITPLAGEIRGLQLEETQQNGSISTYIFKVPSSVQDGNNVPREAEVLRALSSALDSADDRLNSAAMLELALRYPKALNLKAAAQLVKNQHGLRVLEFLSDLGDASSSEDAAIAVIPDDASIETLLTLQNQFPADPRVAYALAAKLAENGYQQLASRAVKGGLKLVAGNELFAEKFRVLDTQTTRD